MTDLKGVQFNPPPPGPIMDAVTRLTFDAAGKLPEGAKGGVFAIATTTGVNAVIVNRINKRVVLTGWIGKEWGAPLSAGATVVMTW